MVPILGTLFFVIVACLMGVGSSETPCEIQYSAPVEKYHIDDNYNLITNDGLTYKEGDYWIDGKTARVCICKQKPCIRKCCPEGSVANGSNSCITPNRSTPKVGMDYLLSDYKVYRATWDDNLHLLKNISVDHFQIVPTLYGNNFTCDAYELDAEERETSALLEDGRLKIPPPEDVPNVYPYYEAKKYCLEYDISLQKTVPFMCWPEEIVDRDSTRVYPYFLVVSIFFLTVTLVIYILLPKLRNLPGLCLMCYIICLLVGFSLLAHGQYFRNFLQRNTCRFLAFTIYFSLMASFFWLNVMCYDIYSAFKDMQTVQKKKGQKKFVMYSIYAWGSPTIMLIITFVMDTKLVPNFIPKPQMAVSSCFFASSTPLYIYFYIPMMILLGANIYFFTVTIYKLMLVSKQTEVLRTAESKRHHDKEKKRCILYGKLFIVMGVTWIMEVVSELIGGADYYWYLTDIINICQGISIFVIFVLKRRVLYMLNMKFCPSMNLIDISESTSSKPTNSTISSAHGNAQNGAATNENAGNDYEMEASTGIRREGCINPIPLSVITSEEGSSNVSGYAQSPNKERF